MGEWDSARFEFTMSFGGREGGRSYISTAPGQPSSCPAFPLAAHTSELYPCDDMLLSHVSSGFHTGTWHNSMRKSWYDFLVRAQKPEVIWGPGKMMWDPVAVLAVTRSIRASKRTEHRRCLTLMISLLLFDKSWSNSKTCYKRNAINCNKQ